MLHQCTGSCFPKLLCDATSAIFCVCRSEHEKNRRRDLITALRNRREQMQLSLKRDHSQQNRC